MAKTGPQRYPGASTTYWYGSAYPGSAMEANVIVWHSTEGTSLPSYGGGASAPNFTAKPDFAAKRLVWYQHYDFDVSSRALVNKAGGVQTNTLNACQVEIVGTCDPATHAKWTKAGYQHLYTPELPTWAIRDLAAFAKWASANHGVPLSSGVTFKAYPGSYGANGVRMTGTQWTAFKGHCGHQHVPENDHGDPGSMPIAAILAAAKNGTTAPQEDDMPTAAELAKAVLTLDGVISVPGAPATNPTWTLSSVQTEILKRLDKANAVLAAQSAAIAKLATLAGEDVDTAAVVAAVQQAIADAVIKVDVDVNTKES
ncbi:hypothetical protein [Streptomyces ortus]|uniref:N-acetylmuramoyl-L-alanine amidase n=1 Tax=Streptomyces ortus TaxID=2867268 RepID=A0ABT3UWP2_9ACTN|nr:hypothetical protein [Streptomyces ortus]MCX4231980.1 hypothetical protein [Streptomyces ortus]